MEIGCDGGTARTLRPVDKNAGHTTLIKSGLKRPQRRGACFEKASIAPAAGDVECGEPRIQLAMSACSCFPEAVA